MEKPQVFYKAAVLHSYMEFPEVAIMDTDLE